jgi:hypothetical protein
VAFRLTVPFGSSIVRPVTFPATMFTDRATRYPIVSLTSWMSCLPDASISLSASLEPIS